MILWNEDRVQAHWHVDELLNQFKLASILQPFSCPFILEILWRVPRRLPAEPGSWNLLEKVMAVIGSSFRMWISCGTTSIYPIDPVCRPFCVLKISGDCPRPWIKTSADLFESKTSQLFASAQSGRGNFVWVAWRPLSAWNWWIWYPPSLYAQEPWSILVSWTRLSSPLASLAFGTVGVSEESLVGTLASTVFVFQSKRCFKDITCCSWRGSFQGQQWRNFLRRSSDDLYHNIPWYTIYIYILQYRSRVIILDLYMCIKICPKEFPCQIPAFNLRPLGSLGTVYDHQVGTQ